MSYHDRVKLLQHFLDKEQCEAFLVEDHVNLYYLTGLELSAGKLLVHIHGASLFVDNRYYELCKIKSPFPVELIETTSIEEPLGIDPFRKMRTLGFDSTRTTLKTYLELQAIGARLNITLIPFDDPIGQLRMIKDESEIQALREAGALGSAGFDYLLTLLEVGITERQLAQELDIFWKRHGSKSVAFDPIIAFGANSSMPHYRVQDTPLKLNDIVLLDIGVNYRHYHSDMTRVVFFGEPDTKLQEIYFIVKEAQSKALEICKPGTLIGEIDKAARDYITASGYGKYFTHGLGHGVGLDIHEAPWIRNKLPNHETPLKKGMVITIEPGIYLPGIGGVRIEDCIAIEENGYENLTNRTKDLLII